MTSKPPKHVLQNEEHAGHVFWASLTFNNGTPTPYKTENPNLRYTWDTAEAAERQRPLYEAALQMSFQVVPIP